VGKPSTDSLGMRAMLTYGAREHRTSHIELTMADPAIPEIPRPSQLWKMLSSEKKMQAADAFWQDENAAAEQMEAIATIAQRIKFRVKSVQAMPREKKSRYLTSLAGVSEIVAARLLVAFHLGHQRPMMGSFLDALGISHENGLIAEGDLQPPTAEKLAEGAKKLSEIYPADDVALYLATLIWQDPDTWGPLADVPEIGALAPRAS
jgi:hypothetical protein